MKNRPEQKIIDATLRLLKRLGYKHIVTELQFCERMVDIYAYNKKISIAVEAKVNAPSRAFEQALRHRHIADYTFVSILKNMSNTTAISRSKETGVGIIFVRKDSKDRHYAEIALNGKKSEKKKEALSRYVLSRIGVKNGK